GGQLRGELGALLQGLAHADDAPAADLHTGVPDHGQGVPALLPGVGGDHVGEVGAGRLQVVVVAVDAHVGQVVDLLLGEHAQGGGDLDVDRVLDRLHALAHLLHQALVGAADGRHDAELC